MADPKATSSYGASDRQEYYITDTFSVIIDLSTFSKPDTQTFLPLSSSEWPLTLNYCHRTTDGKGNLAWPSLGHRRRRAFNMEFCIFDEQLRTHLFKNSS